MTEGAGGDGCNRDRCNSAHRKVPKNRLVGKNNPGDRRIKSRGNSRRNTAAKIDFIR